MSSQKEEKPQERDVPQPETGLRSDFSDIGKVKDADKPDSSLNPLTRQDGEAEISRDFLDYTKNLYSKSHLTRKERMPIAKALWYGETYKSPALVKWVNDFLVMGMSEEGRQMSHAAGPYDRIINRRDGDKKKGSIFERKNV